MSEPKPKHFRDWRIIELIAAMVFLPWMCVVYSNACADGAIAGLLTVFIWLCVALSFSIRMMLPGRIRRQYRFRSRFRPIRIILDWTAPALLLISLIASSSLARTIRFELSKDALAQLASDIDQLEGDWQPYMRGEWRVVGRQVGLFEVSSVARYDNTLYLSTGNYGMFFDECGYAYSPDGPLEERPSFINLGHMSGDWYRYHFIE